MAKRRVYRSTVRFTEEEYTELIKMLESEREKNHTSHKPNVSDIIRRQTFASHLRTVYLEKELHNLTYQIRKIGVNINQITKKINAGFYHSNDIIELQNNLTKIQTKFDDVIKKLNESETF